MSTITMPKNKYTYITQSGYNLIKQAANFDTASDKLDTAVKWFLPVYDQRIDEIAQSLCLNEFNEQPYDNNRLELLQFLEERCSGLITEDDLFLWNNVSTYSLDYNSKYILGDLDTAVDANNAKHLLNAQNTEKVPLVKSGEKYLVNSGRKIFKSDNATSIHYEDDKWITNGEDWEELDSADTLDTFNRFIQTTNSPYGHLQVPSDSDSLFDTVIYSTKKITNDEGDPEIVASYNIKFDQSIGNIRYNKIITFVKVLNDDQLDPSLTANFVPFTVTVIPETMTKSDLVEDGVNELSLDIQLSYLLNDYQQTNLNVALEDSYWSQTEGLTEGGVNKSTQVAQYIYDSVVISNDAEANKLDRARLIISNRALTYVDTDEEINGKPVGVLFENKQIKFDANMNPSDLYNTKIDYFGFGMEGRENKNDRENNDLSNTVNVYFPASGVGASEIIPINYLDPSNSTDKLNLGSSANRFKQTFTKEIQTDYLKPDISLGSNAYTFKANGDSYDIYPIIFGANTGFYSIIPSGDYRHHIGRAGDNFDLSPASSGNFNNWKGTNSAIFSIIHSYNFVSEKLLTQSIRSVDFDYSSNSSATKTKAQAKVMLAGHLASEWANSGEKTADNKDFAYDIGMYEGDASTNGFYPFNNIFGNNIVINNIKGSIEAVTPSGSPAWINMRSDITLNGDLLAGEGTWYHYVSQTDTWSEQTKRYSLGSLTGYFENTFSNYILTSGLSSLDPNSDYITINDDLIPTGSKNLGSATSVWDSVYANNLIISTLDTDLIKSSTNTYVSIDDDFYPYSNNTYSLGSNTKYFLNTYSLNVRAETLGTINSTEIEVTDHLVSSPASYGHSRRNLGSSGTYWANTYTNNLYSDTVHVDYIHSKNNSSNIYLKNNLVAYTEPVFDTDNNGHLTVQGGEVLGGAGGHYFKYIASRLSYIEVLNATNDIRGNANDGTKKAKEANSIMINGDLVPYNYIAKSNNFALGSKTRPFNSLYSEAYYTPLSLKLKDDATDLFPQFITGTVNIIFIYPSDHRDNTSYLTVPLHFVGTLINVFNAAGQSTKQKAIYNFKFHTFATVACSVKTNNYVRMRLDVSSFVIDQKMPSFNWLGGMPKGEFVIDNVGARQFEDGGGYKRTSFHGQTRVISDAGTHDEWVLYYLERTGVVQNSPDYLINWGAGDINHFSINNDMYVNGNIEDGLPIVEDDIYTWADDGNGDHYATASDHNSYNYDEISEHYGLFSGSFNYMFGSD